MITFIIYLLSFMALLGVLVTIHEYGHFIVARLCKVHVQRFSLGMGPVMYTKLDKHGTEFALSLLPLGGYVSMITNKLIEVEPEIKETLTDEQLKNTFDSKPKWQRASIMFAGPLANFLLSIFIFSIIFLGEPLIFFLLLFLLIVYELLLLNSQILSGSFPNIVYLPLIVPFSTDSKIKLFFSFKKLLIRFKIT